MTRRYEPLTVERAQEFVTRILCCTGDEQALALVALIGSLASDQDEMKRRGLIDLAIQHAFTFTKEFDVAAAAFREKAMRS